MKKKEKKKNEKGSKKVSTKIKDETKYFTMFLCNDAELSKKLSGEASDTLLCILAWINSEILIKETLNKSFDSINFSTNFEYPLKTEANRQIWYKSIQNVGLYNVNPSFISLIIILIPYNERLDDYQKMIKSSLSQHKSQLVYKKLKLE